MVTSLRARNSSSTSRRWTARRSESSRCSMLLAPRRKSSWFAYGWLSLLWLELRLPSDNFLSVETLHFKGECILLGRVHKDDSTHKHRTWFRGQKTHHTLSDRLLPRIFCTLCAQSVF